MKTLTLTHKVLLGLVLGIIVGLSLHGFPQNHFIQKNIVDGVFDVIGQAFINLLKMLIVPIVSVSVICSINQFKQQRELGRIGLKTVLVFIAFNMGAAIIGLSVALFFQRYWGSIPVIEGTYQVAAMSFKTLFLQVIPSNIVHAMGQGNILQVIVFSCLVGIALFSLGPRGQPIVLLLEGIRAIFVRLIQLIMRFAPLGVFCLMAWSFARLGFDFMAQLLSYFLMVLLGLSIQLFMIYPGVLRFIAKLNPILFFKKMRSAMLFAFSTSSSVVTMPVTLDTVEHQFGVHRAIANFVIPLGTSIHLNGTAVMQAVAAIFIAAWYQVPLTIMSYVMIIIMITITAVSTTGIPGAGIITLAVVLKQVGLPIEGIGLIVGIDRLLDMIRSVVNVCGDATAACVVATSENKLDPKTYDRV